MCRRRITVGIINSLSRWYGHLKSPGPVVADVFPTSIHCNGQLK